jgi:hypothetical protein
VTDQPGFEPTASPYPPPSQPAPQHPDPATPRPPWITRDELVSGALLVLALVVAGAVVGVIWHLWSDTATRGLVYYKKAIVPDETEGFVSSDGRFVVLTAILGLLAGIACWLRPHGRGPVGVAALAIGAVLGSFVTGLVGYLIGGGSTAGAIGTQLARLPLEVHARGFYFVEAFFGLVVYLVCALFVSRDDLGVDEQPPTPALVA